MSPKARLLKKLQRIGCLVLQRNGSNYRFYKEGNLVRPSFGLVVDGIDISIIVNSVNGYLIRIYRESDGACFVEHSDGDLCNSTGSISADTLSLSFQCYLLNGVTSYAAIIAFGKHDIQVGKWLAKEASDRLTGTSFRHIELLT